MTMNFNINDGATINFHSDRQAVTIIEVSKSGRSVKVQYDNAALTNPEDLNFDVGGFAAHVSGTQKYECRKDEDGQVMIFSLRKSGRWVLKGDADGRGVLTLTPGRNHHRDYNF
jgi:hypothetical protein